MLKPLQPAQCDWNTGVLRSTQFDDVYASQAGAFDECQHVFIAGNQLPERWKAHPQSSGPFRIGEIGFGTGTNFCATIASFLQHAPAHVRLDYYACEKHPMSPNDLAQFWKEHTNNEHLAALIDQWPPLYEGRYSLLFAGGRVRLLLLFGDALEMLHTIQTSCDAWYADGFTPQKNPALWQTPLFTRIAQLSKQNSTLSTYSAAGAIRRSLQDAGFTVTRTDGFGKKRHMTQARIDNNTRSVSPPAQPWFHPPVTIPLTRIAVIGAGIAGCSIAAELSQRGHEVVLFEKHTQASGASGNWYGLCHPLLGIHPQAALSARGYLHTRRLCEQFPQEFWQTVTIRVPCTPQRFEKLSPHFPDTLLQQQDDKHCLLQGLAIQPPAFCAALTRQPTLSLREYSPVHDVQHDGKQWHIDNESFSHVIYANAFSATESLNCDDFHLQAVRGQVSLIPADHLTGCYAGSVYWTPARDQFHCAGASFIPDDTNTDIRIAERNALLAELPLSTETLPALTSRASIRCGTRDRFPLVGALPQWESYQKDYSDLHKGRADHAYPSAISEMGAYCLFGFGSRGLSMAPFCAAQLAATICGETPLCSNAEQALLHPARFWVRTRKSGKGE